MPKPKSNPPAPESVEAVDPNEPPELRGRLRSMAADHLRVAASSLHEAHALHDALSKLGAADSGSSGRVDAIAAARTAIAKIAGWTSAQPAIVAVKSVEPAEALRRWPPVIDPAAALIDPSWMRRGRR